MISTSLSLLQTSVSRQLGGFKGTGRYALKYGREETSRAGNDFVAESKQPLSSPVFSGQILSPNLPMDMDNKSTKTSIHTHIPLTRLPLYPSQLPICAFLSIYTLRVERWEGSRLHSDIRDLFVHFYIPRPLTPRKKIGAAHANKETFFLFLFLENLSSTILLFLARNFLYTYPLSSQLYSPCVYFLSQVWCHFLSGVVVSFGPCNDSHHVLFIFFFFSFSYLSGASSPSLQCITVRRVSHTILPGGRGKRAQGCISENSGFIAHGG